MNDEPKLSKRSGSVWMGCVTVIAWAFIGLGVILFLLVLVDCLVRDWKTAPALVVGVLPMFLGVFILHIKRQNSPDRKFRQRCAGEPWLLNPKWANGRIRNSDGAGLLRVCFLVTPFLVTPFLVIGIILMGNMWKHGDEIGFRLSSFWVAACVSFLFAWVMKTLRFLRYGSSVLELVTFPGVIGGQLVGMVYTRHKILAVDGYHLRLRCIGVSGSAETVAWEDEATMVRGVMDDDASRTVIPVGFYIPGDCPPTEDGDSSGSVYWQLQVRAKVAGLDYVAEFKVPVFRTAESGAGEELVDPVAAYRAKESS